MTGNHSYTTNSASELASIAGNDQNFDNNISLVIHLTSNEKTSKILKNKIDLKLNEVKNQYEKQINNQNKTIQKLTNEIQEREPSRQELEWFGLGNPPTYVRLIGARKLYDELKKEEELSLSTLNHLKNGSLSIENYPKDFNFPLGHPRPNVTYIRHPLWNKKPSKKFYFIPDYDYEKTLQQEEQTELVSILSDLGAKEIYIAELNEEFASDINTISATILNKGASISNSETIKEGISSLEKQFLKGSDPPLNKNFDRSKYFWLSEHPEWNQMINSRINHQLYEWTYTFEDNTTREYVINTQLVGLTDFLINLGLRRNNLQENCSRKIIIAKFSRPKSI